MQTRNVKRRRPSAPVKPEEPPAPLPVVELKWRSTMEKLAGAPLDADLETSSETHHGDMYLGGPHDLTIASIRFTRRGRDLRIVVHYSFRVHRATGSHGYVAVCSDFFNKPGEPFVYTPQLDDAVTAKVSWLLNHKGSLCTECLELSADDVCESCQMFARASKLIAKPHEYKTCAICLSELTPTDKIAPLRCGHLFHLPCLTKVEKPQCPCCRRPFRSVAFHGGAVVLHFDDGEDSSDDESDDSG